MKLKTVLDTLAITIMVSPFVAIVGIFCWFLWDTMGLWSLLLIIGIPSYLWAYARVQGV